jgi:hypothetical protein
MGGTARVIFLSCECNFEETNFDAISLCSTLADIRYNYNAARYNYANGKEILL